MKVSGLGLPDEMQEYTESGCAPQFALWSFVDLGYLTYYATYGIVTGQIEAAEGQTFTAGRMGEYTIETDPTRDNGLRIVMGPFTVYNDRQHRRVMHGHAPGGPGHSPGPPGPRRCRASEEVVAR